MRRFKYLFLAVVAITGLIGATPIDRAVQLPPITALNLTIQQGEVTANGYAAPEMRERLITLAGTMQSGTAKLSEQSLELRGVASADGGFGAELTALRDELPQHISANVDVFVIDTRQTEPGVCERMFDAVSVLPAQFDETGILMRTSSRQTLDRIVDFAEDCEGSQIELAVHAAGGKVVRDSLRPRQA